MTRADEIATQFGSPVGAGPRAASDDSDAPTTTVSATEPSESGNGREAPNRDSASERARTNGQPRHPLELRRHVEQLGADPGVEAGARVAHPDAAGDAELAQFGDLSEDAGAHAARASPAGDEVVHPPRHETLPEIARHAAGVWLKAAGWTAGTSLRVGNELRKIATDPNAAQDVIDEVTKEVREVARDFLGITELDAEVQEMAPLLSTGLLKAGGSSPEALRAQGEQLLREAADVGFDEGAHPAFARILTELSPDEARILRLLAIEGAEPMVDIRAHNLIGNGSQLIAQSLNMLGSKAGLRRRERVPVYLTNLVRCNLIVLSDDPLESPAQYQVLEAQPEVLSTMRDTIRAKVIRRSVLLTPLGQEFCDVCLPVHLPALPPPSEA
jgi:hypothetical protein